MVNNEETKQEVEENEVEEEKENNYEIYTVTP